MLNIFPALLTTLKRMRSRRRLFASVTTLTVAIVLLVLVSGSRPAELIEPIATPAASESLRCFGGVNDDWLPPQGGRATHTARGGVLYQASVPNRFITGGQVEVRYRRTGDASWTGGNLVISQWSPLYWEISHPVAGDRYEFEARRWPTPNIRGRCSTWGAFANIDVPES